MGNEGKSEQSEAFKAIIRLELLTGRYLELEGPCPAAAVVDPSSWAHGRPCSVVFKSACTTTT